MTRMKTAMFVAVVAGLVGVGATGAYAQTCNQPAPGEDGNGGAASSTAATVGTRATFLNPLPPDYIIGADDVLTVHFWRDETMSGDVVVRPDGKITLPLVNDVHAAGLTPVELCVAITEAARKYLEAPTVAVTVKQINSRRVFIQGMVGQSGPINMTGPMTVLQALSLVGGLQEFADKKNIVVIRKEAGKDLFYKVNYEDISKGKNLSQNIELRPGDIIIVK